MIRARLLLLTGLAAGVSHASAAQDLPTDSLAVAAAVDGFHDALARGDSVAALAMLAPDLVVLESGERETLAEYRAHHLAADIEFVRSIPGKRRDVQVTVGGDVAWVTSSSTMEGTFRGRPVHSAGVELMVLSRTGSGWVIRAIHWSSRTLRSRD